MKLKTIILDYDGTLVESQTIKDQAFAYVFRQYPDKLAKIMDYHLKNNAVIRFDKFKYIAENIIRIEYDLKWAEAINQEFSQFVLNQAASCSYVFGAIEFLDYFYQRVSLYLASVNPPDELAEILKRRNLTKYFKAVYANPWKKPDSLKEIISVEAVHKDEVVFIGDTYEDYQAAQAVGIEFIGRDGGKPFNAANIKIFKDLVEIKECLKDYGLFNKVI